MISTLLLLLLLLLLFLPLLFQESQGLLKDGLYPFCEIVCAQDRLCLVGSFVVLGRGLLVLLCPLLQDLANHDRLCPQSLRKRLLIVQHLLIPRLTCEWLPQSFFFQVFSLFQRGRFWITNTLDQ